MKSLPLPLSVSHEERFEVLGCFHGVVKMYRYSLEEWVFIVKTYWITGSIKNCQGMFVEQFGGKQAPRITPYDWLTTRAAISWISLSYLIFSCCQLYFCEFPKYTTTLHYRYDMQMYCTFVPFCKPKFPVLPVSGTRCMLRRDTKVPTECTGNDSQEKIPNTE
jgi:hypothetical protein